MGGCPYVFVVGCARSGTTLLQRMLDHHPSLAVAEDSHFIPFAPGLEDRRDPPVTAEVRAWLLSYPTIGRLGLEEAALRTAAKDANTYAELVTALYEALARRRAKPLAGEKAPRYVRHLPTLHGLFPGARTVHLVRDGRDVALSMMEWARPDRGPGRFRLWAEQPVAVSALSWRWHVSTGMRDGVAFGPGHYCEVGYERLLAEPETTLREIAAFLALPYAPEMLDFHRGRTRTDPKLSTKAAWLPPTAGLRDWRRQMPGRDVELYEAIAGDLLSLLGYERAFPEISEETAALAVRCRSAWEAELQQRTYRLASRFDPAIPIEALRSARLWRTAVTSAGL